MALPIFQTPDRPMSLMQTQWASQLNPLLKAPSNQASQLKNIKLVNGRNVINHLLGHTLNGWALVRQRQAGTVFDQQDANQQPDLTLILISSGTIYVDILVY